jgi:hypothetical protein
VEEGGGLPETTRQKILACMHGLVGSLGMFLCIICAFFDIRISSWYFGIFVIISVIGALGFLGWVWWDKEDPKKGWTTVTVIVLAIFIGHIVLFKGYGWLFDVETAAFSQMKKILQRPLWELSEDQYKLTMLYKGDKGMLMLVEITDDSVKQRRLAGVQYALYMLRRRQDIPYVDYKILGLDLFREGELPRISTILLLYARLLE